MAESRAFRAGDIDGLLTLVSGIAAARWPGSAYRMTSDVAWALPAAQPEQNLRLWFDAAGLLGYVWFEPTTDFAFDVRGDVALDDPAVGEMFDWAEDRRRAFGPAYPHVLDCASMVEWEQLVLEPTPAVPSDGFVLTTTAFDRDRDRIALLERRGFAPTDHTMAYLRRPLDRAIPDAPLPAGARVRHVTDADLAERVAVHRDAWWPARGFDAETYAEIRSGRVYDRELDLVLEMRDGTFASYCIGWADSALGVGSFEPVGTRRDWRRRGLGKLVNFEGLRRMKARGLHSANIQTAGFNERALALYLSCAFEGIDTKRTYTRRV